MHNKHKIAFLVCGALIALWIVESIAVASASGTVSFGQAIWPTRIDGVLAQRLVACCVVLVAGLVIARRSERRNAILYRAVQKSEIMQTFIDLDTKLGHGSDASMPDRDSLQDIAQNACARMAQVPGIRHVCVAIWMDKSLVVNAQSVQSGDSDGGLWKHGHRPSLDDPVAIEVLSHSGVQLLSRSEFPSLNAGAQTGPHDNVFGMPLDGVPARRGILLVSVDPDLAEPDLWEMYLTHSAQVIVHHLTDSRNDRRMRNGREAIRRQSEWMAAHLRVINCLSAISQIAATTTEDFLQQAVGLIPMVFPSGQPVAAQISYVEKLFEHGRGSAKDSRLSEPLNVDGQVVGMVEVWLGNSGQGIGSLEDGLHAARFVRQAVRQIELMLHHHRVIQRMNELSELQDAILQSTAMGLAVIDGSGRIKVWNRAAEKLTNKTSADVLGSNRIWRSLFDKATFRSILARVGPSIDEHKLIQNIAASITLDDGHVRHLSADMTPLSNRGGGQRGYVIAARDDTQEVTHRAALMAERNRLKSVLDALPELVYLKDTNLRYTQANKATCGFFGLDDPAPLLGKSFYEYHPSPVAQDCEMMERAIMAQGEPHFDRHVDVVDAEGRDRALLVSDIPLRDPGGDVIGLIGVCHDVTEYRQLQGQLLEARKMEAVGQLAGGAAHDFNNLLTVISLQGELLLAITGEDDMTAMCVEEILDATERASRLTQQLLAFGRRQIMDICPIDLNECVTELQDLYRSVVAENVMLDFDLATDLELALADEAQIAQILTNLVLNASEAMPNGGILTIKTSSANVLKPKDTAIEKLPPGSYAVLSITDTGKGMTTETQQHLFEPFFTTKEVGEGSGMGLATVFGIAQQLGGGVDYSTSLGEGSTFSVYLPTPAQDSQARPQNTDMRPGLPEGTETILLVEDERHLRLLSSQILEQLGYIVIHAENGRAGVDKVQQMERPPDLILSDVVMPELGGPQMVACLAELGLSLPVVYMTGYSDDLIDRRTGLGSDQTLLHKPFKMHELATAVRSALDAS